ncbi:MAG: NAD(P)-binding protein [bacterium]|nr:NAD(P)-binding protein [bacterium]
MSKQKIAVLGGGIGALSAVFELTEQPGWQEKYDIAVYTLGWRLGGKGASGRNQAIHNRIEEHGLHVWGGFYDNAFRLMQRCYDVLNRPNTAPLATWNTAFTPFPHITLMEKINDEWVTWPIPFPINDKVPGYPADPDEPRPPSSPGDYLCIVLEWIQKWAAHLLAEIAREEREGCLPAALRPLFASSERDLTRVYDWLTPVIGAVRHELTHLGKSLEHQLAAAALHVARQWQTAELAAQTLNEHPGWLRRILDELMKLLEARAIKYFDTHNDIRRAFILIDFAVAHIRGFLKYDLFIHPFDSINHLEYSDWLREGGATELTLKSVLLETIYQTVFAYENGDKKKPNVEAGTMLRNNLRLVRYRGSILYKMMAGMGDVVFAPLYEVLAARGVQFNFFCNVNKLCLNSDKTAVGSIELTQQVRLKNGSYQPLININNLPCWPNQPLYDQIDDDQARRLQDNKINLESYWANWSEGTPLTLRAGNEFDLVLLGIPIGALREICSDFLTEDAPTAATWNAMLDNVKTVSTQGLQLWLKPDLQGLGWTLPPAATNGYFVNEANPNPMDTWADMSHLIPQEGWDEAVGSIAYFCGAVSGEGTPPPPSDHAYPGLMYKIAEATSDDITDHIAPLWPLAVKPGKHVLEPAIEVSRYIRANIDPGERYVLTHRDTTRYRLAPTKSGLSNLILTGDWVDNRYNLGMIEAAVMGGMLASRAICGFPQKINGEGDFD